MITIKTSQTLKSFAHPRVITMFFFGISAGIPIVLIFGTLSLWLAEAGVDKATVTMFSWAALGYSFKFIWAPLVDKLPIPFLTGFLGKRRSWLLFSQIAIMVAIVWMASTNPAEPQSLMYLALATVMLGFSSATQDIMIDAYRIESADSSLQALMSSTYIAGYRIGMLIAGAGALLLVSYLASKKGAYQYEAWMYGYLFMAGSMLIGAITTLIVNEPDRNQGKEGGYTGKDYLRLFGVFLLSIAGFILAYIWSSELVASAKETLVGWLDNKPLAELLIAIPRLATALLVAIAIAIFATKLNVVKRQMVDESYIAPVKDFFSRYHLKTALLLLALVGLYRISDIVLGVIANYFYYDIGFSKVEIASVVKTFGLFMTIFGGFVGGLITVKFGVMRTLLLGAILTVVTNLLFVLMSRIGYDTNFLFVVISADNLTAGIASAVFIAFLSRLTNIEFTATQYAIFSSVMTLLPKAIGGYSGSIVESIGYENFFWFASALGVPIVFLVMRIQKIKDQL